MVPDIVEGRYYVSEDGHIYNTKTDNICNGSINHWGYCKCKITTDTPMQSGHCWKAVSIHRMVAGTYVYDRNQLGLIVNHKDCNKANNYFSNLEWVTPAENIHHASVHGLMSHGENHCGAKLKEAQVHEICQILQDKTYTTIKELASRYGVDILTIRDIAIGNNWKEISCQYNIEYSPQFQLKKDLVEDICKIFQRNKGLGFEYSYNQIVRELDVPDNYLSRKKIRRIFNRNPRNFKNISDKYDY